MITPPSPEQAARFRADFEALAARWFDGAFGTDEPFGVAVSGGPDSLALLLLAHAACPGRVRAATVDHGLRPEAADEARFVAGICERLGVPHEVFTLSPDDPTQAPYPNNLQARARYDRYDVLNHWLRTSGMRCLLTAHHADDQAETLLMRLQRGSGVRGLAGVRAGGELPIMDKDALLLRPLLGWRRAELAAIVDAAGIDPVRDPSNENDRFDRARIRKHLAEAPWLDAAAIARSAELIAQADEALEWAVWLHWEAQVKQHPERIRYTPCNAPPEIVIRLLRRIVEWLNGEPEPRGRELVRLAATLEAGGTATLAGIKCSGGKVWRFEPAPPRRVNGRA